MVTGAWCKCWIIAGPLTPRYFCLRTAVIAATVAKLRFGAIYTISAGMNIWTVLCVREVRNLVFKERRYKRRCLVLSRTPDDGQEDFMFYLCAFWHPPMSQTAKRCTVKSIPEVCSKAKLVKLPTSPLNFTGRGLKSVKKI